MLDATVVVVDAAVLDSVTVAVVGSTVVDIVVVALESCVEV